MKDVQVVEDHYQSPFDTNHSRLEFADHASLEQPFKRFQKAQRDYTEKMTFPERQSYPTESFMDSLYYLRRPAPLIANLQEHGAYSSKSLGRPKMHWGIQNFHSTFIVAQGFVEALEEASQIYESKIEEDRDILEMLREYEFKEDYEKTEVELGAEWARHHPHLTSCRVYQDSVFSMLQELRFKKNWEKTEDEVLFERNNPHFRREGCFSYYLHTHYYCDSCPKEVPKCSCL